ncbi:MAG: hypothetical protein QOF68_1985 [Gaiellales bacterium]|jgi:hypothetical protein|nr:hypothetical protein [Gaiellales bacterium]
MSRELEERLERALSQVEPGDAVTEQARAAAMDALPRGLRVRHRAALLIAAAVAVLALTGGTLAASETAREVVGISSAKKERAPAEAPLPAGASGFATVVGETVWLARPNASESRPARFTAFDLSPNAIYVAAGSGNTLLALDPSGLKVVKRHRVEGRVTAITWAPIGIYIAYVVRTADGSNLHLMEGNFTNDRVVARRVSDVTPSWRWDSLAVAFAKSDGSVQVLDLGAGRTFAVEPPPCSAGLGTGQLAFAPYGGRLAVSGEMRYTAWIADTTGSRSPMCVGDRYVRSVTPVSGGGVAWLGQNDLVMTAMQRARRLHLDGNQIVRGRMIEAPAGITAIATAPDRRTLAVALEDGRVVVVAVPSIDVGQAGLLSSFEPAQAEIRQVLLNVPELRGWPLRVTLLWR